MGLHQGEGLGELPCFAQARALLGLSAKQREGQEGAAVPCLLIENGTVCQLLLLSDKKTKKRWKSLGPQASFVAWTM